MDLSRHPLYVGHINYFLFDEYLDGYPLACQRVGTEFDLAECSFADSFADEVVAYFFLFASLALIHNLYMLLSY